MLTDDELETIEAIARNRQSGRVTEFEIKELVSVYRAARDVANTLNGGFVACPCGRQESTTETDFAPELYKALGVEMKNY